MPIGLADEFLLDVFAELEEMGVRPPLFARTTTRELWTDPHLSRRMLESHLDGSVDRASGTAARIAATLQWLIDRFTIGSGDRVLDLGCGPGLYTNRLADTGAEVIGVDWSSRSVAHARATAPEGRDVRYLEADYLDATIEGTFDLVVMIMRDYGALTSSQRRMLLSRVRELLAPQGRFVFDVDGSDAFPDNERPPVFAHRLMNGFWSSEPYFGFHHTFLFPVESVVLDRFDIFEAHRRRTFFNWCQHFDQVSLAAELDASGFAIEELLGDMTGAPIPSRPRELCVVAAPADPHRRPRWPVD